MSSIASILLLGIESLEPDPAIETGLAQGVAGIELLAPAITSGPPPRSWRRTWGQSLEAAGAGDFEPLVAMSWQASSLCFSETVPELGFLGWELSEGGQPLEVMLSALGFGKELAEAGVNFLLGPSLALASSPSTSFGARPDMVGQTASIFQQGLASAGVLASPGRWDGACLSADGLTVEGLPFGALASHGAVAFEVDLGLSTVAGLRSELEFDGVAMTPPWCPEQGMDPIDFAISALDQGFDLVRLAGDRIQDDFLGRADSGVEQRGITGRLQEARRRVASLRSKI